jgi:hypothetical protein
MVNLSSATDFALVVAVFPRHRKTKKADVAGHPSVQDHVGLLVNRPPGTAGLPFI